MRQVIISSLRFVPFRGHCVCVYRYSKRFSFEEASCFDTSVPGDLSPHLSSSLGSFQARYAFCQVCFLGFRLRWSRGCQRLEWSWHQRRPWLFPVIWKRDAVFTYLLERLNKLFSSGCLSIFRQVGFSIFQNSSFRMRRPHGVSVCLRWKATQDIRRRRWHHSQSPLTITPQCGFPLDNFSRFSSVKWHLLCFAGHRHDTAQGWDTLVLRCSKF